MAGTGQGSFSSAAYGGNWRSGRRRDYAFIPFIEDDHCELFEPESAYHASQPVNVVRADDEGARPCRFTGPRASRLPRLGRGACRIVGDAALVDGDTAVRDPRVLSRSHRGCCRRRDHEG